MPKSRAVAMSKPDDIPQDVWDGAEDTLDAMLSNHGYEGWRADSIATIARAIMAAKAEERERCAVLIERGFAKDVGEAYRSDGKPSKNDKCPHDLYMYEDCELCAAFAIRRSHKL